MPPKTKTTPEENVSIDTFLDNAQSELGENSAHTHRAGAISPEHRRLRIQVSPDKLEAYFQAIYRDTTPEEIQKVLDQEQITWGIQQEQIDRARDKAIETSHVQKDILAALGRPAQYVKKKEVIYTFLEDITDPETQKPVTLTSSIFRELHTALSSTDIEKIRCYNRPVIAVAPNTPLMTVNGKDEIEYGYNVYGEQVKQVLNPEVQQLKAGIGVLPEIDGALTSERFGYLAVHSRFLVVLSPIWISPDRLTAYFINPPQVASRIVPQKSDILKLLEEEGITHGIDHKAINALCSDLAKGKTREACIPIAKGHPPELSNGQFLLTIDILPPAYFDVITNVLSCTDPEDADLSQARAQVVNFNTVLARQALSGDKTSPGKNIFGQPISAEVKDKKPKVYKAGANVRKEEKDGFIYFISDIYGYVGIDQNSITVLPPLWISPDRMTANFVALPIEGKPVRPDKNELQALIDQLRIRHGIVHEALEELTQTWPKKQTTPIAQGSPPIPGDHGKVEIQYKQMPDPGKYLETGQIDFRERETVPQASTGDLLAIRTFPTTGQPGKDIRGRKLPPKKTTRGLLYAGPNVKIEEKKNCQHFYATDSGWPRVIKDTLGVMKRFVHKGNIDYRVGNINIDGDVVIQGSIKSRFTVKATGDVFVEGAVDINANIDAGGNIIVQKGIHKSNIKAGGDLVARFIQDSNIEINGDLLVRNYLQNCKAHVGSRAIVQGEESGQRQLCVFGGTLVAAQSIDVKSTGVSYGRPTRVATGFFVEFEKTIERYKKGLDFCDMRTRKTTRALESLFGQKKDPSEQLAILKQAPEQKRLYALERIQEHQSLIQMRESLLHHIQELEKNKQDALLGAEIRILGTCFRKTTVQIGQIYETISIDEENVSFSISPKNAKLQRQTLIT